MYDPSLTRAVLPKEGEIVSLSLLAGRQEIASLQLPNWGRLPKWSDNGERLAIIGSTNTRAFKVSEELYVVSRDGGTFQRMTFLSNTFQRSAIADYAWSPDGNKIAFWLYSGTGDPTAEGTQSELMILDIQSGLVTNLCVQGISSVTHIRGAYQIVDYAPIWSPDGMQLLISQWDKPGDATDRHFNVLVVDLARLVSVEVDQNREPVRWMIQEP